MRVDKNVEFTCGTYLTQEEAAIAVNLCKKRLGDIGAETYTDIENILNFDKKAFAKDIQDEVETAIKNALVTRPPSGERNLTADQRVRAGAPRRRSPHRCTIIMRPPPTHRRTK